MSVGLVAFLVGVTAFLVVYAIKAPFHRLPENEDEEFIVAAGSAPTGGFFERIVRPMVRNILPQTPLSAQLKARQSSRTVQLLIRSGNPWNIQPEEFFGIRLLGTAAGLAISIILVVTHILPNVLPDVGWILLGAWCGWYYPKVQLDKAKGRREKAARKGLPEALDLLVITMNAGNNFGPALAMVVQRLPEGLIREELGRVSLAMRSGQPMQKAMLDFARRAPSEEVESFCKAVVMAEKLGADVTETLRAQAEAARQSYEAALDVRIGKLPTTLYFPILGGMLPALFIVILAPAFSNIAQSL